MKKTGEIKLSYNVPIVEAGMMDNEFIIQGVAINATTTSNNHKFLSEELRNSASSLTGVPLLVDHKNEVSAIKGRVKLGEYDEANNRINFKAKVVDADIKAMIKDGLINSVSVGAAVAEIDEGENGVLIPKGIVFKELSLVAVPADGGATFTTALHEAYKLNSQDEEETEPEKELDLDDEIIDEKKADIITSTDNIVPIEMTHKSESEKPKSLTESESMKGGKKMSEEITKVEQKVETNETLNLIKSMTETMKQMQEKIEALSKPVVTTEVEESDEKEVVVGKYKIVQGFGDIRGDSFTLVR